MRWLRTPLGMTVFLVCIAVVAIVGWKTIQSVLVVRWALDAAQQARIRSEQEALSEALRAASLRYATNPPTSNNPAEMKQVFFRMFPRYRGDPEKDLAAEGLAIDQLDNAEMLVFFLGGLPDKSNPRKLIGFSPNPTAPFDRKYFELAGPVTPGFDFDPERLVDTDGDQWLEYQTPALHSQHGVYMVGVNKVSGRPRALVSGLTLDDEQAR